MQAIQLVPSTDSAQKSVSKQIISLICGILFFADQFMLHVFLLQVLIDKVEHIEWITYWVSQLVILLGSIWGFILVAYGMIGIFSTKEDWKRSLWFYKWTLYLFTPMGIAFLIAMIYKWIELSKVHPEYTEAIKIYKNEVILMSICIPTIIGFLVPLISLYKSKLYPKIAYLPLPAQFIKISRL